MKISWTIPKNCQTGKKTEKSQRNGWSMKNESSLEITLVKIEKKQVDKFVFAFLYDDFLKTQRNS